MILENEIVRHDLNHGVEKMVDSSTTTSHPDGNGELGERMTWKCATRRATSGSSFWAAERRMQRFLVEARGHFNPAVCFCK